MLFRSAAPRLARILPFPSAMATAVAVPLAAQLATAPLLLSRAGGLPVVSVPANVLVEPAAGAVMTWGSSAGVAAGYLPAFLAAIVHLPTRLLLWWIDTVAVVSARYASVTIGPRALAAAGAVTTVVWVLPRLAARLGPPVAAAAPAPPGTAGPSPSPGVSGVRRRVVAVLVVTAAVEVLSPGASPVPALPTGVALFRNGSDEIIVLSRPCDGARLLAAVRARAVGRPEVVVVTSPAAATWRVAAEAVAALRPELVLAASDHPGAVTATAGEVYRVGTMRLTIGGGRVTAADPGGSGADPIPLTVTVDGAETGEPP